MSAERRASYRDAADAVAYSSLSDEQAREELERQLGADRRALELLVAQSAERRSDYVSDRRFRLLSAIAQGTRVRPIDPAMADIFTQEAALGRMPLADAFARLVELEPRLGELGLARTEPAKLRRILPGVWSVKESANLKKARRLVGIGPPSRAPLLRSPIAVGIVRQYLEMKDGIRPGDVTVPYFEDPQVLPATISFGVEWEKHPDGQTVRRPLPPQATN